MRSVTLKHYFELFGENLLFAYRLYNSSSSKSEISSPEPLSVAVQLFVLDLVRNPEDRFCCDAAHLR